MFVYTFSLIWIKFGTGSFHKILLSDFSVVEIDVPKCILL